MNFQSTEASNRPSILKKAPSYGTISCMKNLLQKTLKNEVVLYIIAGGLTTLFYFVLRLGLFLVIDHIFLVTLIANTSSILFAFVLNDWIVFKQPRTNRIIRLGKFFLARISTLVLDIVLAYLLVDLYPEIIGQFVNHQIHTVNAIVTLISQILILVINYVLSKWFIFNQKQSPTN